MPLRRDDLQVALDAPDRAAALALAYFRAGVSPTLKADGSQVTEADRAVERLLRVTLSTERPGDALLGEELGRLGTSDRLWIIDPIDGTAFFSRGDPNWRVDLALQVAGRTELAVVTAPALRLCWWAIRGGGAFESAWPRRCARPTHLAVSGTSEMEGACLEAVDDASRARLPWGAICPLASPLPLVELVRGEIDAFLVERYHLWDHAPWILLTEEAGGRFTDRTGGRAGDQGGGLYSNAKLHPPLLAALQYPTRPWPSPLPSRHERAHGADPARAALVGVSASRSPTGRDRLESVNDRPRDTPPASPARAGAPVARPVSGTCQAA